MKKSALKRRATLKKSLSQLRKTKLEPVSAKQKEANAEYREQCKSSTDGMCAMCGSLSELERHHPYGRRKKVNLLRWLYLCKGCHTKVHNESSWAYSAGWLQPEYRGLEHNPNHLIPWNPKDLTSPL